MGTFTGKGNLGDTPKLKMIPGRNGDVAVAEMRVFFGRHKVDKKTGEIEQVGGYWLPVSLFDAKGEAAAKHLRRGARVQVTGELIEYIGKAEDGTERELFQVKAEDVSLILTRIDSISFKQREEATEPA